MGHGSGTDTTSTDMSSFRCTPSPPHLSASSSFSFLSLKVTFTVLSGILSARRHGRVKDGNAVDLRVIVTNGLSQSPAINDISALLLGGPLPKGVSLLRPSFTTDKGGGESPGGGEPCFVIANP